MTDEQQHQFPSSMVFSPLYIHIYPAEVENKSEENRPKIERKRNTKTLAHHILYSLTWIVNSANELLPFKLTMENIGEEYGYWPENDMLFQNEDLGSWAIMDEAALSGSGYYDSSSPDGTGASSSVASKNIVSERNRRKKLNDRLFALRAVVPNITKMDKASIIKDAIEYIQHLHDQEKRIQAEILDLESGNKLKNPTYEFDQDLPILLRSKKKRTEQLFDSLRVTYMGEKTFVVSLTCSKRTDTMVKLCAVFESLKLKVITANITSFSGTLLKTVFIQVSLPFCPS
ncbi:Transcription factor bHLH35 isoform B [Glycine soja]|uniref:Transcription factor bHLH35 isoform B n=1 Tax=Glycine soja TaxID=3848 RepID=A0A445G2L9_GLYSO|nr:Transcription factor bHLH35 isoform B [Glycine soja]